MESEPFMLTNLRRLGSVGRKAVRLEALQKLLGFCDQAYQLARQILKNPQDAEDAVQEACLKAVRFEGSIPQGKAARPWFLCVVANTARDLRSGNLNRRAREEGVSMEQARERAEQDRKQACPAAIPGTPDPGLGGDA